MVLGFAQYLIRAAEYHRLSREQGNAEGQCYFGNVFLETGRGVDQYLICAAEYYCLSAEQGNADGQFNFAVSLEKEFGIRADLGMTARYYKLGFDQGTGCPASSGISLWIVGGIHHR
jgi:TPR repeat protein